MPIKTSTLYGTAVYNTDVYDAPEAEISITGASSFTSKGNTQYFSLSSVTAQSATSIFSTVTKSSALSSNGQSTTSVDSQRVLNSPVFSDSLSSTLAVSNIIYQTTVLSDSNASILIDGSLNIVNNLNISSNTDAEIAKSIIYNVSLNANSTSSVFYASILNLSSLIEITSTSDFFTDTEADAFAFMNISASSSSNINISITRESSAIFEANTSILFESVLNKEGTVNILSDSLTSVNASKIYQEEINFTAESGITKNVVIDYDSLININISSDKTVSANLTIDKSILIDSASNRNILGSNIYTGLFEFNAVSLQNAKSNIDFISSGLLEGFSFFTNILSGTYLSEVFSYSSANSVINSGIDINKNLQINAQSSSNYNSSVDYIFVFSGNSNSIYIVNGSRIYNISKELLASSEQNTLASVQIQGTVNSDALSSFVSESTIISGITILSNAASNSYIIGNKEIINRFLSNGVSLSFIAGNNNIIVAATSNSVSSISINESIIKTVQTNNWLGNSSVLISGQTNKTLQCQISAVTESLFDANKISSSNILVNGLSSIYINTIADVPDSLSIAAESFVSLQSKIVRSGKTLVSAQSSFSTSVQLTKYAKLQIQSFTGNLIKPNYDFNFNIHIDSISTINYYAVKLLTNNLTVASLGSETFEGNILFKQGLYSVAQASVILSANTINQNSMALLSTSIFVISGFLSRRARMQSSAIANFIAQSVLILNVSSAIAGNSFITAKAFVYTPRNKDIEAETYLVDQRQKSLSIDGVVFAEQNVNVVSDALIALQVGDIVVSFFVYTDILSEIHVVSDLETQITLKTDVEIKTLSMSDIVSERVILSAMSGITRVFEEIAGPITIIEQE